MTTDSGNLEFIADANNNGHGSFNQDAGTTIATTIFGNITIQSSGTSTLANINSAGDLILEQGGAPAVFTQQPGSTVSTVGSIQINSGVTLNAADALYLIGKDWLNYGTFTPNISSVSLVSAQKAKVIGDNTFYDFTIDVPGKEVDFGTIYAITINNKLELKGSYGNLLVLESLKPGTQWQINVEGDYDIEYVLVGDSISVRGPPLQTIHSSTFGNLTNWYTDSFWTGEGNTNNWSDGHNWDTGTAPTSFDTVTFDGTTGTNPNKNSTVDQDFTIGNLIIDGYTGIITLDANLTVTENVVLNSGSLVWIPAFAGMTVEWAGMDSILLTIGGNWLNGGGNFQAGASTVVFDDATQISYITGNNTFYNLTIVTPGKTLIFEAGSWKYYRSKHSHHRRKRG